MVLFNCECRAQNEENKMQGHMHQNSSKT